MASRRTDTKKPEPDRAPVKKTRKCLMCRGEFHSHHVGERVCPSCKETSVWRSGGIAA
jgi:predicted RNA-binding Zn-ribbon protein involved in translation (DUF1610 family)